MGRVDRFDYIILGFLYIGWVDGEFLIGLYYVEYREYCNYA